MTISRRLASCAITATLAATGAYVIATAAPSLAASTAKVWLTTPDRANLLRRSASAWTSRMSAPPTAPGCRSGPAAAATRSGQPRVVR